MFMKTGSTLHSFFTASNLCAISGGLEMYTELLELIHDFKGEVIPCVFVDYGRGSLKLPNINMLVLTSYKNELDLVANLIDEQYIIVPSKFVVGYSPKMEWSIGFLTDPHHGNWHNYVKRFPNQRWEFSYELSYGFVFTDARDKLIIPLNIDREAKYLLFMRVLKSPRGGAIKITLNNETYIINTIDERKSEFIWIKVGEFKLHRMMYELEIENLKGSNVINLLILIPETEYQEIVNEIKKLIQDKIMLYLFKAEFQALKVKIIKDPTANRNNLMILEKGSVVRQNIHVLKSGTYRIALKGEGAFKVEIGDNVFILKSNGLGYMYTPSFYLTRGDYMLKITPLNITNLVENPSFEEVSDGILTGWRICNPRDFEISFDRGYDGNYSLQVSTNSTKKTWSWIESKPIDVQPGKTYLVSVLNESRGKAVTWFDNIRVVPLNKIPKLNVVLLYSTEEAQTIDQLFKIKEVPAKTDSNEKINPTLWKVKVNATKPFMLIFTETFNPLWEARVYKDGRLVERIRSVPVYGVINGFWINETGNLTIVIRYVPQDWFELGLKISATTFALCVFYLVWDWRRGRGDGWAIWLENVLRNVAGRLSRVLGGLSLWFSE